MDEWLCWDLGVREDVRHVVGLEAAHTHPLVGEAVPVRSLPQGKSHLKFKSIRCGSSAFLDPHPKRPIWNSIWLIATIINSFLRHLNVMNQRNRLGFN